MQSQTQNNIWNKTRLRVCLIWLWHAFSKCCEITLMIYWNSSFCLQNAAVDIVWSCVGTGWNWIASSRVTCCMLLFFVNSNRFESPVVWNNLVHTMHDDCSSTKDCWTTLLEARSMLMGANGAATLGFRVPWPLRGVRLIYSLLDSFTIVGTRERIILKIVLTLSKPVNHFSFSRK
jgi:hypothetical protein